MKIILGSDHGGVDLKDQIKQRLIEAGHDVTDCGCPDHTPVDYPDIAATVCHAVLQDESARGMLFCGTGIGIGIAANKVAGIRAALVTDCFSARMAREHNNAQIVTMGGRTVGIELAWSMAQAYLNASFLGGIHATRVGMISNMEQQEK